MNIIKRSGLTVKFDRKKIESAIKRAMKYGSGIYLPDIAKLIAKDVESYCKKQEGTLTIEQVEVLVFEGLVHYGQSATAKYYEEYRTTQAFRRQSNTTDEAIMGLIQNDNEDTMKENSNKNAMIAPTQRDLIAGEVSKDITRRKLLPTHIVQAHDEGIIHFHDMDYSLQKIFNCCLVNLEDMLDNGTVINDKMVESPKSFSTACTVVTQIMAQIASGQYGK